MTNQTQHSAGSAPVDLVTFMFDAGMIQFGAFEREGQRERYLLRLDLLISYPEVLRAAAQSVAQLLVSHEINRIVCLHDSIAIATLVSQLLDIPLIAHSGVLGHPAANLIGAYDVGHPAALIGLSSAVQMGFITQLQIDAEAVGINLVKWVSLVQITPVPELDHVAAVDLSDAADQLAGQGRISARMASRIPG